MNNINISIEIWIGILITISLVFLLAKLLIRYGYNKALVRSLSTINHIMEEENNTLYEELRIRKSRSEEQSIYEKLNYKFTLHNKILANLKLIKR